MSDRTGAENQPKKPGPLSRLVDERSDITFGDLEKFFEKQSDVYSPVWLLLAGLVLGGGTVGILELIKQGSVVPSPLTGVWIGVYIVAFWTAVAFILIGLAIVGYAIIRYNPLKVQELLVRDYLDAKAKLRKRLDHPAEEVREDTTLDLKKDVFEPKKPPISGKNDFGIEKVKFYWDYERSRLTSLLIMIFSALVAVATIANAQVASPVIKLNPIAEAGLLTLVFVFVIVESSKVAFRMNKMVHQTDKLLTKIGDGDSIPSLRDLCEIKYESKSGWDELRRVDPHVKIEIIVLVVVGLLLIYIGFGGPI